MKRIILLLAISASFLFQGCTTKEEISADLLAEVFEVRTSFTSANNYSKLITLNPPIYSSDMVLVYRSFDVINNQNVWRQLPQTVYLAQGELDYNFDFTRNDINLFLDSDFDLATLGTAWSQNQLFRVVIIPGYFSNKYNKAVDFNDYNAVVKAFNIKENQIKTIQ
ncbi:MAG: hypothetical protein K9I35_07410 [Flavobacterium sp.]|jgi:hypothetical protein|nr:hypothetical protein [Flavobacterium sp.]